MRTDGVSASTFFLFKSVLAIYLYFCISLNIFDLSLVTKIVKNLFGIQKTHFGSLSWEDPLKKGMAYLSSILAQRIPWTGEFGGLQSMGLQSVSHDWVTNTFIKTLELACQVTQNILLIFDWDCIKSVQKYWQN